MLRKLVKFLIPSQDRIFFEILMEATKSVDEAAKILDQIMKEKDGLIIAELAEKLRLTRAITTDLANKIDQELNKHFVTPIDRVELHNIITLLLKLNKRIVKIYRYMQILMEEEKGNVNLYLSNCVETLRKMTRVLDNMMKAFDKNDYRRLKILYTKLSGLDENVLEDLGYALKKFSYFEEGDVIFIMKVKDIYKAIEHAISTCTETAESMMRIYVKEV